MFTMSKRKAFWLMVFSLSVCIVFAIVIQQAMCLGIGFGMAAFYGTIWLLKSRRDQRIVERASSDLQKNTPRLLELPPMTSKGSHRLFIPEPLDDKR